MTTSKTYKLSEIVGTSTESFAAAVRNVVRKAGETLRNLDWWEVPDMRGRIEKGEFAEYPVTVKLGLRVA